MSKFDCIKKPKKTAEEMEREIKRTRNFDKVQFLDLSKPGRYKVRLVGSLYTFKISNPNPEAYPNYLQRFSIYVFDRNDENKLKIMEKGYMLFNQFLEYKDITRNDPVSIDNAPSFVIEMFFREEKIGDRMVNMFMSSVMAEKDICPLTKEEIKRFQNDSVNLNEYYLTPHRRDYYA